MPASCYRSYALPFLLGVALLSACGGDTSPSTTGTVDSSDTTDASNGAPGVPGAALPDLMSTASAGESAVERALRGGDASVVDDVRELERALVDAIDNGASAHVADLASLLDLEADGTPRADGSSLTAIDWNPTHDAALFQAEHGENAPLLITNAVTQEGYDVQARTIAVIGESTARYVVMGSNPMRNHRRDPLALNEAMHRLLENTIRWLSERDDLGDPNGDAPFKLVATQLAQSYYFPDEIGVREWFDERFPGRIVYNEPDDCDGDALADCLAVAPDLLIVSNHLNEGDDAGTVAETVAMAMDAAVPVLYLHHDGSESPLSDALLPLFDVRYAGDNYWRKLSLSAYDRSESLGAVPDELVPIRRLAVNLRDGTFPVDWADCDGEDCSNNASLKREFQDGASAVRSMLGDLDEAKIDLFAYPDRYRFKKLLALLGDRYRTDVAFPMDRHATPTIDFLRALYADHAVYRYRPRVAAWSDLGNFARNDYSHVTPVSRTVRLIARQRFRATGAYALPGRPVTVTRGDSSEAGVRVRVNTLRDGSTHVHAEFGYVRPRALWQRSIPIEPGETIRFTSAIGGPLQLEFDGNGETVEVVFDNVGEHAYWRDSTDDERFTHALHADELDWAEIATPSFEVHSTREKMIESLENPMFGSDGGTPADLAAATTRYVHDLPHVLAGFRGPGVREVPEIHDFAATWGLEIHELDRVKHMNADQAACGYGCSGNPYDAYWSFSPIGHGDLHELGHGLERARFRFTGWPGHASTNFYSYYAKSHYFEDTGEDPNCQSLPFRENFEILRASRNASDPGAYVRARLWNEPSWSEGAAAIIQMMMAVEAEGLLEDGWHLLARLHLIEREYQQAIRDEEVWLAKRHALGMHLYSRSEAQSLNAEDWLLITMSHASGRDVRDWFAFWGHRFTDEAASQVAAMSLPALPVDYYVSSPTGYCRGEGFDGRKLAIDGVASWPLSD